MKYFGRLRQREREKERLEEKDDRETRAVVVAQLAERSLPMTEVPGLESKSSAKFDNELI